MSAPIVLGYWKIRGLAQPIRLLMEYLDVNYTEKLYTGEVVDGVKKSQWFEDKASLGLEFPNLPYLIDNEKSTKLSQSNAIARYICRKYNRDCLGKNDEDMARVDMIYGMLADIKGSIGRCVYGPKEAYPEALDNLKQNTFPDFGKAAVKALSGRTYLAGDYVTYVDFILYELYDVVELMTPGIFSGDEYKPLRDFINRIVNLPKIAAYLKSDKFISRPINGPSANFN